MAEPSKARTTIDVAASVAMLAVAILVGWRQLAPSRPPSSLEKATGQFVGFADAAIKGGPTARVGMVVFSDFECPYCGTFARTIGAELDRRYVDSGTVLIAFRHKPLTAIHANALMAAKATHCATRGGKFWPFHDLLFSRQQILSSDEIRRLGRKLNLDTSWDQCLESDAASDAVASDIADANSLGVTGTPAFLIGPVVGGQRIKVTATVAGVEPLESYTRIFDNLLAQNARDPG